MKTRILLCLLAISYVLPIATLRADGLVKVDMEKLRFRWEFTAPKGGVEYDTLALSRAPISPGVLGAGVQVRDRTGKDVHFAGQSTPGHFSYRFSADDAAIRPKMLFKTLRANQSVASRWYDISTLFYSAVKLADNPNVSDWDSFKIVFGVPVPSPNPFLKIESDWIKITPAMRQLPHLLVKVDPAETANLKALLSSP